MIVKIIMCMILCDEFDDIIFLNCKKYICNNVKNDT